MLIISIINKSSPPRAMTVIAAGLTVANLALPPEDLMFQVGSVNMPWLPPVVLGIVGIILGLYVSSFPARHFVDLLIYWKTEGARFPTRRSLGWWIAENAGVLLVGFLVIVFAAARFTAGPVRG